MCIHYSVVKGPIYLCYLRVPVRQYSFSTQFIEKGFPNASWVNVSEAENVLYYALWQLR